MNTLCLVIIAFAIGGLLGIATMSIVNIGRSRDSFHQPIRSLDADNKPDDPQHPKFKN